MWGCIGLKLSIIIPARDEAAIISKLLESLQPARAAGHEVILVDGQSSDKTCALAAGKVDLLLSSPPGRARQMNMGARASTGDLLWFVHADAQVSPQLPMLLAQRCRIDRDCWGFFAVSVDDPGRQFRLLSQMMNWRSGLTAIATGDQGIFVRRDVFFAVNCYPDISLMEDIALSRALKKKARPRVMPESLGTSARRWREHGFAKTVLTMWALRLAFWLGISAERIARRYPQCNSSQTGS